MKCAVIIVTNNSEKYIHKAIQSLNQQTVRPESIVIVDTGSKDVSYLSRYRDNETIRIILADKGIGFCKGNNIGMKHIPDNCRYVFFLNPDAFPASHFIETAVRFMDAPEQASCGALTGTTLGYDIVKDTPTGKYDTTGVFRTWYGKWYDRGQGQACESTLYRMKDSLPAICGAVFFCRKGALDEIRLRGDEVFDSTFFMYKEDIDLSIRLRRNKWNLAFLPELVCYHCRGWNPDRRKMPRELRLHSARNELTIQIRQRNPIPILYSLTKLAVVKVLDW